MSGRPVDRRAFMGLLTGGLTLSALPGCAALAATTFRPERGEIRLRLADYPGLDRAGGSMRIRAEDTGELYYVLRQDDGSFETVSPVCTHQGCTVQIAGRLLECPCHGSIYDLRGTVVRGPAERPLRQAPTRLSDGRTLVIQTAETRG